MKRTEFRKLTGRLAAQRAVWVREAIDLLTFSAWAILAALLTDVAYAASPCSGTGASTAMAWGTEYLGRLGNGAFGPSYSGQTTPVLVTSLPGGRTVSKLVAGSASDHALAIAGDGTIWAWGKGNYGQLGNGAFANSAVPVQALLPGGRLAVSVASGEFHSLALANDGTLWAWGAGNSGQLGNGSLNLYNVSPLPVNPLPGGRVGVAIGAGVAHSLALANDGTVWAWGRGVNGELGNGAAVNSAVPVEAGPLPNGRSAVAISSGGAHNLVLASDGTLWTWGSGGSGQLGNASHGAYPSLVPIQVDPIGGGTPIQISAGSSHNLVLADDNTVWAWGWGFYGQLGHGMFVGSIPPVQVNPLPGGRIPVLIEGGFDHSLAIANDGTVWAWGRGGNGQLGNGDTANSAVAVQVSELPGSLKTATMVAAGNAFSLALVADLTAGDPPTAIPQGISTCPGAEVAIVLDASDPNNLPLTFSVLSPPTSGSLVGIAPNLTYTPNPGFSGADSFTYAVLNSAGCTSTATVTVSVEDTAAPLITLNGAPSLTLECGIDTYSELGASVTDACDAAVTAMIGGDTVDASTPGTYYVTYNATDASGNIAAQATRTVTVGDNTVPAITLLAPASGHVAAVGTPIVFSADIDEACGLQQVVWEIRDFDDRLTTLPASVAGPSGTLYAVDDTVSFIAAGIYSITLVATDAFGNQGAASVVTDLNNETLPAFVVIYDPAGGFVTGGGWIWSPEGALHPGLAEFAPVTGKARFGFMSKYKQGATVPSGNTEFHFEAGDLEFKSSAYQWLVVAGKRAQFKGWGTINSQAGYQFMLTAIDGDLSGGDGSDRFRIKLWEETSGTVVYDNQANSDDNADLANTTIIDKGKIVIHTK